MKTIITIITFVLAVIGITVSLTQTPWIIVVSALVGLIFISSLLFFGYLAETKDNRFFRSLCYYFNPTYDKYKVTSQIVTYKYLEENKIEYSEAQECISLKNCFDVMDKAIYWYGDNNDYFVSADDQNIATTTPFKKRQNTKYFSYRLINGCTKRKSFKVNYTIHNLTDTEHNATFNKVVMRHKVKYLKLKVVLPNTMEIHNVNFVIQNRVSAEDSMIPLEYKEYNDKFLVYEKDIEFPRRHWTYSIEWEFK